jgi:type I restriction-modification system DNA methylase subunit
MTNRQAYELNRQIEALIDQKGINSTAYSADEKAMLSQYSGYGGLDQFLKESNAGILYEFFTPIPIVKKMWGLALKLGFKGGEVLEPAAGNGVFLAQVPARQYLEQDAVVTAIEPQQYSYAILRILYPEARAIQGVFEQQFINERINESVRSNVKPVYDLVIGNPPYGSIRGLSGGKYMNMGEKQYTNAHAYDEYFIRRGVDLLKPGGILIYIIGSEVANGGVPFLQRGNSRVKDEIAARATLSDAYRLPNGVFDRTEVLSDIVCFTKNAA